MTTQTNILFLNNKSSTSKLIEEVLAEYTLSISNNIDNASDLLSQNSYDLLLVSLCENYDDYNQKIEQLKIGDSLELPVLYLACDGIDLHNKGIDYCKIESISEPYGRNVFTSMVNHTINEYSEKRNHKNDVAEVAEAMMSLQNDNAKLYDISRFLQQSFFCKDIKALCEQLFVVTRAFNTSCTLYIHSEKNDFFISDGIVHSEKINIDILTMLKNEARIYQFGNDRAVFNWTCASLLVAKLGSDVDNLAMLMDGFEMGFRAIESVDEFNHVLNKYRQQNYELKIQVAKVVEDVAANITDELSQLGATAMLTEEQENSLVELADQGRKEVDGLFNEGMQLDEELSQIMIKMRTQSESKPGSEADSGGDNDSIDFF